MATQAVAARNAFVSYAATSSGSLLEIGEVRNFSLDVTQKMIDASSNDSSGWDEMLGGQRSYKLNFEAVYARTNAQQVALRKCLSSGTMRYFEVRPSTSQTALWKGNCFTESYSIKGDYQNIVATNMVLTGTRSLTYTT